MCVCVCVCVCIVVLGIVHCVCVHCGIRDVFTVQVVCKGRGGEVWGVGDCDSSAPLHTTVLPCILLCSLAYYCALLHTTVLYSMSYN